MIFALMVTLTVIFGFSVTSHAALFDRGTDSLGNKLIYDDDLNITWYDYSNVISTVTNNWQEQVDWASALTVDFGVNTYDDWRLPVTVDDSWDYGVGSHSDDGSTSFGHNFTDGELGHLFYTELGNLGRHDTSGAELLSYGLDNVGVFTNLFTDRYYWFGTEHADNTSTAWDFSFNNGLQNTGLKNFNNYGIAVRSGDVSLNTVVPEPSTYLLLGSGIAGLILWRRRKKLTA